MAPNLLLTVTVCLSLFVSQANEDEELYCTIRSLQEDIQQLSSRMNDMAHSRRDTQSNKQLQDLSSQMQAQQNELRRLRETRNRSAPQ